MTKENFLDKWIEALPLNSKDADRKEMAYDIDLMLQKQALSIANVVGQSEQLQGFAEWADKQGLEALEWNGVKGLLKEWEAL